MGDDLPIFGTEEKEPTIIGDLEELEVYRPRPRIIRKRARPPEDSPDKPAKKIKVEPSEAPLMRSETDVLDMEELKKKIIWLKKEYDKITFGLKIVRKHMGSMMECIRELSSLHHAGDK